MESRPEAFSRLIDCRKIDAAAARLACYDKNAAAIDAAATANEIVVLDRAQIRKTRRSLFGFTLPKLGLFGDADREEAKEEPIDSIDAVIANAVQRSNGRWQITLEDGARWTQIDSRELTQGAKKGDPIRIRRASMGTFFANIRKQTAIRMQRDNF